MLRDSNGRKKIPRREAAWQLGTIDGVPYIINSVCEAISSPIRLPDSTRWRMVLSNLHDGHLLRLGSRSLDRLQVQRKA